MKNSKYILFVLALVLFLGSCEDGSNSNNQGDNTSTTTTEEPSSDNSTDSQTQLTEPETDSESVQESDSTAISIPDDPNAKPVKIGDKAHGGIVFQVDNSGKHGLVCQAEDLDKLMTFSEAKKACEASNSGGKNDWRLPSLDELEHIYIKLRKSGLHHFHQEWYWSSKVKDRHNAWSMDVLHGKKMAHWENEKSHVRAVRAF